MIEIPSWTGSNFAGSHQYHDFSFKDPQKNRDTETFSISDLIITNSNIDGPPLILDGNYFMIDLDRTNSYFHFLLDQIGQYEYVKTVIPDVKLLVITKNTTVYPKETYTKLSVTIREILSRYDVYGGKVINLSSYSKVVIEKLYICSKYFNYYTTDITLFSQMSTTWKPIINAIQSSRMNTIRKKGIAKKIFISKRYENEVVRKMKTIYDKRLIDRTDEEKVMLRSFGGGDNYIKMKYRFITEEDEIMVEKFFIDHGYEIVFAQDQTFQEQLDIFHAATHIVSFKGASTVNAIFSKPGTKVIMLNNSNKYSYPHESILLDAGMDVMSLPEYEPVTRYSNKEIMFSGQDIIDALIANEHLL